MEQRRKTIGLDDSAIRSRLKTYQSREPKVVRRAQPTCSRTVSELVYRKPLKSIGLADRTSQLPASQELPRPKRASLHIVFPALVGVQPVAPLAVPVMYKSPHTSASRWHLARLFFRRPAVLTAMAAVLFIIGLSVSFLALRTNNQVTATVHAMSEQTGSGSSDGNPEESEPSAGDLANYQVAADLPRYVRIPKLDVNARVMRMGIKPSGELKAPNNIFDVGWYENSNKPSDPGGAALFDAHVSGPTKHGVFHNLKQLAAGDLIEVEQGNGQKLHYKVVRSQVYDKDAVDMAAALVSAVPGKAGLNLMTCTGLLEGDDYQQRLVVFAVRQ